MTTSNLLTADTAHPLADDKPLLLGVLGPTVPAAQVRSEFDTVLAEFEYLTAAEQGVASDELRARSARLHDLIRQHRPTGGAYANYLLWLVRVVATANIAGKPDVGRMFLETESVKVHAAPESWLDHARESALVAFLEHFGGLPRDWQAGGNGAAAQLVVNQRAYEPGFLDALPVDEARAVAFGLLGAYHLASAAARLHRLEGKLGGAEDEREAELRKLWKAFEQVTVACQRTDDFELLVVVPLLRGASRARLG